MSWDRTAVAALPLLLPVGFFAMVFGSGALPLGVVGAAELGLVLGLVGLARRSKRHVPEDRWRPPTPSTERLGSARRRGSVVLSLAGVEIRELLLSPWFQAGVGFCGVFLVGIVSFERGWWGTAALMPLLVHPLCGFTIVAVHRNVSRARRDGTDELLEACPVTAQRGRRGHLLTSIVPVAVASAFVAISLIGASIALDHIYGPLDGRVATDVVIASVLLPVGATALGVLLGSRVPYQVAPVLALAVIAIINLEFWDEPDGRVWLATGLPSPTNDHVYLEPPTMGRLGWMLGLVVIVATVAVAGTRSRTAGFALAGGVILALGGITLTATGPSVATAQTLAGYVRVEDRVTACTSVSATVEVCVPEPYRDHGSNLAEAVAPVAAAVPIEPAPTVAMWLVADNVGTLQRAVRDRVSPTPLPPEVVPLPFGHHESHRSSARFDLAAALVGIPVGPSAPHSVLVDGEARGVVMLWLAANELEERDLARMLTPDDSRADASYRGHLWPGTCGADVQWAPQDVEAARAVTALERTLVAEVLAADWTRWTDAATTTDDLMAALGLAPVGPPEPIEPLGDTCS